MMAILFHSSSLSITNFYNESSPITFILLHDFALGEEGQAAVAPIGWGSLPFAVVELEGASVAGLDHQVGGVQGTLAAFEGTVGDLFA
jgi:hypothetical protein